MLKIAHHDEPRERLSAHAGAMQTLWFLGEFSAAHQHAEQVREIEDGEVRRGARQMSELTVRERGQDALMLALLGYPNQAVLAGREAVAYARQSRIPVAFVVAELFSAFLRYFIRNFGNLREPSEAAFRLANEHGRTAVSGYAAGCLGWVEAFEGDGAKGIKEIRRSLEVVSLAGNKIRTMQDMQLLDCLLRHGRIEEGLAAASDALAHVDRTGERYCTSELNRFKGELLLRQEPASRSEAESAFRTSIEIARGQEARWWQLRAATSLARLLRDTNRADEARAMLSEIYNWFTEGFDTADLKDAKTLLEELAE
jgi:hypothetical protein